MISELSYSILLAMVGGLGLYLFSNFSRYVGAFKQQAFLAHFHGDFIDQQEGEKLLDRIGPLDPSLFDSFQKNKEAIGDDAVAVIRANGG